MSHSDLDTEPRPDDTRGRGRVGGGKAVAAAVVALLVLAALVVFALSTIEGDEPVEDVLGESVSEEAYRAVEVGQTKEDVLRELRPAAPLDTAVIAEYQERVPETPAAECVYYESDGGTADDKYRFCFVEDELVDKTVVLPPSDGVTGN